MFLRQLFKSLIDAPAELGAGGLLKGVAARARQALNFIFGVLSAQHSMAILAAAKVNREIGGDAIEPGREARTGFELGEVLVGADEGFLSQLNSIILVMHDGLRDADHPPLLSLNQGAESLKGTIAL